MQSVISTNETKLNDWKLDGARAAAAASAGPYANNLHLAPDR